MYSITLAIKKRLSKISVSGFKTLFVLVSILFYCGFVLLNYLDKLSFFQNFEPYPDGLFFLSSAKNGIFNQFSVVKNANFSPQIGYVYSAYLSIFLMLGLPVESFIFANVTLIASHFYIFWLLINDISKKYSLVIFFIYFFLPIWWWMPMLPMSESMSLFLISTLLVLLRNNDKKICVANATVISILLFLTKYSMVLVSFFGIFLSFLRVIKRKKKDAYFFVVFIVCLFVALNSYSKRIFVVSAQLLSGENQFYSFKYIVSNSMEYLSVLWGGSGQYLWQNIRLFPSFLTGISFYILLVNRKKLDIFTQFLGILFLAHFPVLLIFYVVDLRYLITVVPITYLLYGAALEKISFKHRNSKYHLMIFISCIALFMFFTQAVFWKQIIGTTFLKKSVGWQYVSVLEITKFMSGQQGRLVTALPPLLFSLRGYESRYLLPLSSKQEFFNDRQLFWDDLIPNNSPVQMIESLLVKGEKVFVTNSYITHSREVVADYEKLKNTYQFILVFDGCNGACSIYLLEKK